MEKKKKADWRTTLVGIGTGALYLFLTALQSGIKPRDAAIGLGIGMLGKLAGDSVNNPKE